MRILLVSVLSVFSFIVLFSTSSASAASIIGGPVSYSGHIYYKLDTATWSEAEATAVTLGGHLATVNDAAENQFILDTFATGTNSVWIGLNDAAEEGTWEWVSTEDVTYENWAPDEPRVNPSANYVAMLPLSPPATAGQWDDEYSSNVRFAVVEVVPEPSTAILLGFGLLGLGARRRKN